MNIFANIEDIHNYTIDELIEIFNLPTSFDSNLINTKTAIMQLKINSNNKLLPQEKNKILQFISNAQEVLTNHISYNNNAIALDASSKERLIVNHFNIDTKFRDDLTQSSSFFNINLPVILNNVSKLQLSSIEFPVTFYMISQSLNNDHFLLQYHFNNDTIRNVIFRLKEGNYTNTSFVNALNDESNYTFLDFDGTSPLAGISFSLDIDSEGSGTGKIILSCTEVDASITSVHLFFDRNIDANISNSPLYQKIGWLMGFRKNMYSISIVEEDNLLFSESLLNISGPKYIYIVVDDFNANQSASSRFINAFNSTTLNPNILARIPLSSSNFSFEIVNVHNTVSTPREYTNLISINKLLIQIIDEYGRILDLNDMNISLCLSITSVYDGNIQFAT